MVAMDKIAEDLEDAARRHNSKILFWHVNKLRGSSQSGLILVEDKECSKPRCGKPGKDIEENEKVCDTLDVKAGLFCEEELATALKRLKNMNFFLNMKMSFLNMAALSLEISN